jgi:hypothetical protein
MVGMGESGKGNGKGKIGDNVLPVNLLPYLAEAYLEQTNPSLQIMPSSGSQPLPRWMPTS